MKLRTREIIVIGLHSTSMCVHYMYMYVLYWVVVKPLLFWKQKYVKQFH